MEIAPRKATDCMEQTECGEPQSWRHIHATSVKRLHYAECSNNSNTHEPFGLEGGTSLYVTRLRAHASSHAASSGLASVVVGSFVLHWSVCMVSQREPCSPRSPRRHAMTLKLDFMGMLMPCA